MANFRTIQTSFWTDADVMDEFTPEDRYFYLYLFTNPHTNLCGCYEVSKKSVAWETGYSMETISTLLDRFESVLKVIRYSKGTKEVLIKNWHKYNWTSSEKYRKPLLKEITAIKNKEFKLYLLGIFNGDKEENNNGYGIDTVSDEREYGMDTTNTITVPNTISISNPNPVSKPGPREEALESFEAFWELYPRKEKQDAAARAWISLNPDSELIDTIMKSLKENVERNGSWKRDGGRYIPKADNWLIERRWRDEIREEKEDAPKGPGKVNQFNDFEQRSYSNTDYRDLERRKLGRL